MASTYSQMLGVPTPPVTQVRIYKYIAANITCLQ